MKQNAKVLQDQLMEMMKREIRESKYQLDTRIDNLEKEVRIGFDEVKKEFETVRSDISGLKILERQAKSLKGIWSTPCSAKNCGKKE